MIDRLSLQALPPDRRAAVIYGQAQAEMSQRLWQAALGGDHDARTPSAGLLGGSPGGASGLDALLAQLAGQADRRGDPITAAAEPGDAPPPAAAPACRTSADGGPVDGLGANRRHAPALDAAAARTGIPAAALAAIVDAEAGKAPDGSWQCFSRNPRSSAAGLGQFLSRTWEGLAETSGTWLHGVARANGWLGDNGQVRAEARAALLATRYDPVAAINGVADYARRNLDGLSRAGVAPAAADAGATARLAYLGHHLGLGDAIRFVRDGELGATRARTLLGAQVGASGSQHRIASASGNAAAAHRDWLLGYLDRKVRPDRFTASG